MDRLSFAGLILATLAIVGGMTIEGGKVATLLHLPAFVIVVGGTVGAVMLQSPKEHFWRAFTMIPWIFKTPHVPVDNGIEKIVEWANVSRHNGFLALEDDAAHEIDRFTSKGLNLLIDGVDPEILRDAMDMDMTLQREREIRSATIFEAMGGYSPTIGIIGAVLGLIQAMTFINDPEQLGSGIAVAFVATIYGVGFANLIYIPVANKLKSLIYEQTMYREMITEGLVSIANGENPRAIEMKLSAYRS